MRISALRYMFTRGVIAGASIFGLVMLAARAGGWHLEFFRQPGFNAPIDSSTLAYLIVPLIVSALVGGSIGLITGWYTDRYVKRHHSQIHDADVYAENLGWRTGMLTASLAVAAVFALMLSAFSSLPGVALIILAGVNGGLAGRGYAYYDMAQRREKKQHYSMDEIAYAHSLHRLEDRDTDIHADVYEDTAANRLSR